MNGNPYSPPVAALDRPDERPVQITRARFIMVAAFVVELASFAMKWGVGAVQRDLLVGSLSAGLLILWLVLAWLAWLTARRSNIARTVLLSLLVPLTLLIALVVVGITFSRARPVHLTSYIAIQNGVKWLQLILSGAALWCLISRPTRLWFRLPAEGG